MGPSTARHCPPERRPQSQPWDRSARNTRHIRAAIVCQSECLRYGSCSCACFRRVCSTLCPRESQERPREESPREKRPRETPCDTWDRYARPTHAAVFIYSRVPQLHLVGVYMVPIPRDARNPPGSGRPPSPSASRTARGLSTCRTLWPRAPHCQLHQPLHWTEHPRDGERRYEVPHGLPTLASRVEEKSGSPPKSLPWIGRTPTTEGGDPTTDTLPQREDRERETYETHAMRTLMEGRQIRGKYCSFGRRFCVGFYRDKSCTNLGAGHIAVIYQGPMSNDRPFPAPTATATSRPRRTILG